MKAAQYNAWYDSARGRWIGDTEFALLCRHLDMRRGASVLDVGCGTGWFTRRLAGAGLALTGLDVDAHALDFARQHSDRSIAYLQGDARRLPFADQSFDQVVSVTALCFVDDWPRALAEIVRVTRRRFVLALLNRHSLLWRDKGREGGQGAYQGAHWHSRAELEEAFKRLPVENLRFGTAVFLASGTPWARTVERLAPNSLPWGACLVVSGDALH